MVGMTWNYPDAFPEPEPEPTDSTEESVTSALNFDLVIPLMNQPRPSDYVPSEEFLGYIASVGELFPDITESELDDLQAYLVINAMEYGVTPETTAKTFHEGCVDRGTGYKTYLRITSGKLGDGRYSQFQMFNDDEVIQKRGREYD